MSETVAKLIEAADESERVFGLRNQVVIAEIYGKKRNRRRTVQFIRELNGAVVGRVHYSDQTGTLHACRMESETPGMVQNQRDRRRERTQPMRYIYYGLGLFTGMIFVAAKVYIYPDSRIAPLIIATGLAPTHRIKPF